MDIVSYLILGVSLAMDAFAVSVSTGVSSPNMQHRDAMKLSLSFGLFQTGMTLLGWLLGSTVADYISAADHWIAFGLLSLIGIKMIWDTLKPTQPEQPPTCISTKMLLAMSIATSIDALAVGITLAMVHASIILGSIIIGIITFTLCFIGATFGKKMGSAFGKKATIIGGVILIGIGVKILIEHMAM